jgi:hypothetical protein
MNYRIAQDSAYVGNDYWRWSAWIEAEAAELDMVKEVVWILHPSFKQSRVVRKKKSEKFRLNTAGWGTFLLRAELTLADGNSQLLKHDLRLEYPEPSESNTPQRSTANAPISRAPTVYLSYSTEDSRAAAKLRAGLEDSGFKVLDQSHLNPGEPWSETLRRMIAQSDAVVGLAGDQEISPWVSAEIKAALASSKPAWVLCAESASTVGLPSEVQAIAVDLDALDTKEIAEWLRSGLSPG